MRPVPAFCLGFFSLASMIGGAMAQPAGHTGPIVRIEGTGGAINAAGATVTIRGTAAAISAAGAVVDIRATASGEVRAAGANVSIDSAITGDLSAGGGLVDVAGTISGKARLGGAVVRFDANVTGDLKAGGADVEIGREAVVGGNLFAGGASVTVDGRIVGTVELAGSAIVFNGNAGGTVTLDADEIVIGPAAVITGDLVIKSSADAVVDAAAKISGQTRREPPTRWWSMPSWAWWPIGAAFVAAGAFVAGLLMIIVAKGAFGEGVEKATIRPFSSGLIGLAVLIFLPIVAVLLLATIAGLSVGFALLLVIPMILVVGHGMAAACVGAWILDRSGAPRGASRLILFLLVGAIVLGLVWLIPWVGGLIVGLAGLVGIGAWVRTVARRLYRPAQAVA